MSFDPDDIDAAFAELDARYLAGEAAPHAQTWSAISGAYAALNRRELLATTSDWINVDHRQIARVELGTGDLPAYPPRHLGLNAGTQCRDRGGAQTRRPGSGRHPHGTRDLPEGVDAEWRLIEL